MNTRRNVTRQLITPNLDKNTFDISNWWMGTTRIGAVTVIRWDDVTPNSNWRLKTNFRVKLAPIIFPFTHKLDGCYTTAFVPYRLMMPTIDGTYADWEGFIMGDPQERYTNDIASYFTINDGNKANFYRGTINNEFHFLHIFLVTMGYVRIHHISFDRLFADMLIDLSLLLH